MLLHMHRTPRRAVRYYRSDVPTIDRGISPPPPRRAGDSGQIYYDTVFTSTERQIGAGSKYPPYNVKKNGSEYVLEFAVAGVSPERLDVKVEENTLTITCNDSEPEDDWEYILNTVATRKFTREFTLEENVEVTGSELSDGMLLVHLHKVEDEKISRTIPIEIGGANDKLSEKPLTVEGTDQS